MSPFPTLSSACFAIDGTDRTVTIEGLVFDWFPQQFNSRDEAAAANCAAYLATECGHGGDTLTLIWVTCGPAREAAAA